MRLPREAVQYLHIGLQFAVALAACTALGWWLDDVAGTSPLLLILGAMLGMTAGLYHLVRQVGGVEKRQDRREGKK